MKNEKKFYYICHIEITQEGINDFNWLKIISEIKAAIKYCKNEKTKSRYSHSKKQVEFEKNNSIIPLIF